MSKTPSHTPTVFAAVVATLLVAPFTSVFAGAEVDSATGKDKIVAPVASTLPPAMLTLGGKFSDHLESGYADSLVPFWAPNNFAFFLNTRTTVADNHQLLSSYGLGGRYLVPDHDIILGLNAYYDAIHSQYGNDFNQLGLGAEVLTHWVDARFNYYLPDSDQIEFDRTSRETVDRRYGQIFANQIAPRRILFQQQRFTTVTRSTVRRSEAALEGWNAEVGFLIPGLDKYMETRLFVGTYGYNNPFGKDFYGVKGRAEAHLLPGVIADVEYWEDAYLTGGHWTGELRVTLPFSLFNLASGRNPFEGASEMFHPRQREFRERMTDMVMRSHRQYTVTGSNSSSNQSTSTATATVGSTTLMPPVMSAVAAPAPPPQVGQGEE